MRPAPFNRPRFTLPILFLALLGGLLWTNASPADTTTALSPDSADVAALATANNQFAADLCAQLAAANPGNLFFSPYSINVALAMTYNGAHGTTAEQMSQTLHFPFGKARVNAAFGALSSSLDDIPQVNGNPAYQLAVANSLWGQSGFDFNPDFIQLIKQVYGGKFRQEDYINNPNQAVDDINRWVANKTNNKITDLISSLPTSTRLVLVNAIYFLGSWESPFEASNTVDTPFHLDSQNTIPVPTMQQTNVFSYMETKEVRALQLPYAGNNLAMVILLPRKTDGLAQLEGKLTAQAINQWIGKLKSSYVTVLLPKFQLTSRFELTNVLSALEMGEAFVPGADFSGISTSGPLSIGQVIHQAYVDVNEVGTEAAAATAVGVVLDTVISTEPPPPPIIFRANHPFIFLIRDTSSGAILFMGRVTNPTE